jgi:hypothetical protein
MEYRRLGSAGLKGAMAPERIAAAKKLQSIAGDLE